MPTQIVQLDLEDLRRLLVEVQRDPHPALLTREQCAYMINVSTATLDRLRVEGLPWVNVGVSSDDPRFEREAVLAWLRERPNLLQRRRSRGGG